jgi:ABC-type microcin C transport system permease subunit YejB
MISLFSIFNVAPEKIVSLSLFWFVIIWLFPSLLGAAVAVREGRRFDNPKSKSMT